MAEKKHTPPGDFAVNRKAWHDYTVLDRIECGIQLTGTEVKVVRHGEASLAGAYGAVLGGELYVCGMNIPVYEFGNRFNHDPRRNRKLLMHKREIMRLFGKIKQDGYSLVPLSIYFKGPYVKLEVGLARGKKLYDKRDSAAKKDAKREIDRAMKSRNR